MYVHTPQVAASPMNVPKSAGARYRRRPINPPSVIARTIPRTAPKLQHRLHGSTQKFWTTWTNHKPQGISPGHFMRHPLPNQQFARRRNLHHWASSAFAHPLLRDLLPFDSSCPLVRPRVSSCRLSDTRFATSHLSRPDRPFCGLPAQGTFFFQHAQRRYPKASSRPDSKCVAHWLRLSRSEVLCLLP